VSVKHGLVALTSCLALAACAEDRCKREPAGFQLDLRVPDLDLAGAPSSPFRDGWIDSVRISNARRSFGH